MATEEASSLLERARSKLKGRRPSCSVQTLLDDHSDPQLRELLDNTGRTKSGEKRGEGLNYSVTAETINEAFNLKIDGATISRHLAGKCACNP